MAESALPAHGASPGPVGPSGEPAVRPRVGPWLLLYTLGRLLIAAVLVAAIWLTGLSGFPALLFGLLLSMPVSYVLLRPLRDRLTEGLAARGVARKAAKERLRTRLEGSEPAE
jgi:membrane protein implicated in regulation of membrane protease activity